MRVFAASLQVELQNDFELCMFDCDTLASSSIGMVVGNRYSFAKPYPLFATWGGKGLAHINRASGSVLHRKTAAQIILPHHNLALQL